MFRSPKTAVPAALIVLALGCGAANAGVATGKVSKLDPVARKLMVGRHVYRFAPAFSSAALHNGDVVRLKYGWSHGHRLAKQVLPAAPAKSASLASGSKRRTATN